MPTIVDKRFMHSIYVIPDKSKDAVIVRERIKHDDGSIVPNTKLYVNPKRSFYITKKKYQTYKFKPEYEYVNRLDRYVVPNIDLYRKLAEIQGIHGHPKAAKIFKSPYIFGADVGIEALIKMKYLDDYPNTTIQPVVGFFDIEVSIDTGEIILISYICGNKVYTAVLDHFLYKDVGRGKDRVKVTKDELLKHCYTELDQYVTKYGLTIEIEVFPREMDLITWIFAIIDKVKADFIGIWNMNYDIPKVLERIRHHNRNAAKIFSSTDIPKDYAYLRYHEDKRSEVAHFTLKWHWLYSTCCSQFVDSMGLYSQCRRTAGFRSSYTLDNVLYDELKLNKMPLEGKSHTIAQRHHFMDYVAYNIFDVIGLNIVELKNRDMLSLVTLSGPSPVDKFATQTVRVTNDMYWDLIKKGMILSSKSSEDDFIKLDKLFEGMNAGGAVLRPERVSDVGVKLSV